MLPIHEIFLRLTVAAVLGAIIGIERDLRRRPAGVRTSFFVCMATALFTILSGEIARALGDTGSTRIASNIVQGIGFLGAGAILRGTGGTVGMTTAATIFVEAYATGLVLFGLICLGWAAQRFNLKFRAMVFRITTSHAENVATEVQQLMASLKISMQHFRVSMAGGNSVVEFESEVSHSQQQTIVRQLNRQGVITEVIPVEGPRE
jgi:putative Mg2+ transporter-C (MgtC) family protein